MGNDNELTAPDVQKLNYDILPEGLNIIATGLIANARQYYDLVKEHQRDGYTHHVHCPKEMDRWWEIAIVSRVVETDTALTLQKGCILIFYCGNRESFNSWQQDFMQRAEAQARMRESRLVQ